MTKKQWVQLGDRQRELTDMKKKYLELNLKMVLSAEEYGEWLDLRFKLEAAGICLDAIQPPVRY